MTAPNIAGTTTLTLKSSGGALTTGEATIVNNAASSGTAVKVVALTIANVDGTSAADVTVNWHDQDDIGGNAYAKASTISVAADSSLELITENAPIYLEEDQSLGGLASADGDLVYTVSYQVIS